eukprot:gnl/TRDRNA2_/TRDRNA2_74407_c0_seq1.p1 gnl/TRDRNA2_/TRDRNA2_74407_c0~~gnl/TRDRNA2_/TRDRNA2_74407_c0_seq1.p1  ORF type:complete len:413 (-),score=41.44 gnl/TRDRNA2_/TRDRNA2_74407_c0_seq1:43-1134(-)
MPPIDKAMFPSLHRDRPKQRKPPGPPSCACTYPNSTAKEFGRWVGERFLRNCRGDPCATEVEATPQTSLSDVCEFLAAKFPRIHFVGDSLTSQLFQVFTYALAGSWGGGWGDFEPLDAWDVCGGRVHSSFVRNDFLVHGPGLPFPDGWCEEPPAGVFCQDWWTGRSVPDLLIVNTGAHHHWEPHGVENYASKLHALFDFLKDRGFSGTLVLRTTNLGHPGCHELYSGPSRPIDPATCPEPLVGRDLVYWGTFVQLNNIMRQVVATQQAAALPFKTLLLDVEELFRQRPDRHMSGECLHYVMPGPFVAVAEMLSNLLMRPSEAGERCNSDAAEVVGDSQEEPADAKGQHRKAELSTEKHSRVGL